MKEFTPDYQNILDAARNIKPKRMPIYEHTINDTFMEKTLGTTFADLINGNESEKRDYFKHYNGFFKKMGYDTVSYEQIIGVAMPGSGALGSHVEGAIQDMDDFLKYPWDGVLETYKQKAFKNFEIMSEMLPAGMKAVGGPGYGVFETAQDLVGYENLCIISFDDPELYSKLFVKIGDIMTSVWKAFLDRFSDSYTVCRFGDDLGFKSTTLIKPDDIRANVFPQYIRLVELIHSYNKPFLWHSCGNIFEIMDDVINIVKIDAKHSNEDQIAPFSEWVNRYGDKIGNFGGVDTDHLCSKSKEEIRDITKAAIACKAERGGFALGSGNSIPGYVPVEGYMAMVETAREVRGE